MILTSILLGVAVGALIATFWKDIVGWLKRAADAVKNAIGQAALGATVAVKKLMDGFKEISRHYSKTGTQWNETVVSRPVSESEVPEEIRRRVAMDSETDITKDLEQQLA